MGWLRKVASAIKWVATNKTVREIALTAAQIIIAKKTGGDTAGPKAEMLKALDE